MRYNPVTKGWRLVMRVKVKDAKKTTEMRAALVNADQTLSETGATSYLPMNKTTEYIDAMPIAASEKAALPKTDIRAIHQALDAEHRTRAREDDSPQGSVKARLEQARQIHLLMDS